MIKTLRMGKKRVVIMEDETFNEAILRTMCGIKVDFIIQRDYLVLLKGMYCKDNEFEGMIFDSHIRMMDKSIKASEELINLFTES